MFHTNRQILPKEDDDKKELVIKCDDTSQREILYKEARKD